MSTGAVVRRRCSEPKILVVDDDPEFLDRLSSILRLARYHVLMATDLKTAMRHLDDFHDDIGIAIVDLVLDRDSGFDLISAITRRPNPIRVVAMSALLKDPHLYAALSTGADRVFRKPESGRQIPEAQLIGIIRELLPHASIRANPEEPRG